MCDYFTSDDVKKAIDSIESIIIKDGVPLFLSIDALCELKDLMMKGEIYGFSLQVDTLYNTTELKLLMESA